MSDVSRNGDRHKVPEAFTCGRSHVGYWWPANDNVIGRHGQSDGIDVIEDPGQRLFEMIVARELAGDIDI